MYSKEEIEIFKRVIKDYDVIKDEIDTRIKDGYNFESLFDYIRHLSNCNITNYESYDTRLKYFDFNYNDMCITIYESEDKGLFLGKIIEMWNDKKFEYIDTLGYDDIKALIKG